MCGFHCSTRHATIAVLRCRRSELEATTPSILSSYRWWLTNAPNYYPLWKALIAWTTPFHLNLSHTTDLTQYVLRAIEQIWLYTNTVFTMNKLPMRKLCFCSKVAIHIIYSRPYPSCLNHSLQCLLLWSASHCSKESSRRSAGNSWQKSRIAAS